MIQISRTIYFVLLLVSLKGLCEANPFIFFKTQFNNALSIYGKIKTVQDIFGQSTSSQIQEFQQDINYRFDSLNQKLMEVKDQILWTITTKLKDKISDKIDELFKHIDYVENKYKAFYNHYTGRLTKSTSQLHSYAKEVTDNLSDTVDEMHNALVRRDFAKHESVISIIADANTAADTMCIKGLSSQQLLYDLFNIVANADAKALIVTFFANDVLRELERDNIYVHINEQTEEHFYNRLHSTYSKVKSFMVTAPREVWRCDPQSLQKGSNFENLQEVFQGIFMYKGDFQVVNKLEEVFGPIKSLINLKTYKCSDLQNERLICSTRFCKETPPENRCLGNIRDCQYVSNKIEICNAKWDDERRYLWGHKIDATEYFGNYSPNCPNIQNFENAGSDNMCYCNCESENQYQLRYFSLLEATSHFRKNKVVTGVRFVVDNRVFQIQIQEGELSKEGTIIGEPEWGGIHHFYNADIADPHVSEQRYINYVNKRIGYNGVETHTTWKKNDHLYAVHYNQKTVFLDDIESRGEALVTGLRFKQVDDALRLEVRLTPFDYTTGKLLFDAPNQWKYNENKRNKRSEVRLDAPGNPLYSQRSTQFSKPNSYIQFMMTDLRKDVGQSTVPFIDLQPVSTISKTPFPLTGVGLFHRHDEKTGGFLAFKVLHYNFAPTLPV